MTSGERAQQIWPVLTAAAKRRRLLTYGEVGEQVGLIAQGVGRYLDYIARYCHMNELPPLSIVVVSKGAGVPSDGFVWSTDLVQDLNWVFDYPWHEMPLPTSEDLEVAKRADLTPPA